MMDYIKEPQTTIFTSPTGCRRTHLVLDLIETNIANILTKSSFLAQHFDEKAHIMVGPGSKIMIRFGL